MKNNIALLQFTILMLFFVSDSLAFDTKKLSQTAPKINAKIPTTNNALSKKNKKISSGKLIKKDYQKKYGKNFEKNNLIKSDPSISNNPATRNDLRLDKNSKKIDDFNLSSKQNLNIITGINFNPKFGFELGYYKNNNTAGVNNLARQNPTSNLKCQNLNASIDCKPLDFDVGGAIKYNLGRDNNIQIMGTFGLANVKADANMKDMNRPISNIKINNTDTKFGINIGTEF